MNFFISSKLTTDLIMTSEFTQQPISPITNKQADKNSILFDGMLSIFLLIIYILSALCYKKYCKKQELIRAQQIKTLERMWMLSSNYRKNYQIEELTKTQQIQILERAWMISQNR
jgi:hypothetical protein